MAGFFLVEWFGLCSLLSGMSCGVRPVERVHFLLIRQKKTEPKEKTTQSAAYGFRHSKLNFRVGEMAYPYAFDSGLNATLYLLNTNMMPTLFVGSGVD